MDWNNIDLNSPSERAANLLEPYTFDILLMEVGHNVREINEWTVRAHALEVINAKHREAISLLGANLTNITNQALKERAIQ